MKIQKYKDSIGEMIKINPEIISEELKSLRSIDNRTQEIKEKIYFLLEKKQENITIH